MNKDKSNLTRPIYPMPDYIKDALMKAGLMDAYNERPAYQRNDYIGWIKQAKHPETRDKRLKQMLEELEKGGVYMKMKHSPSNHKGYEIGLKENNKNPDTIDEYIAQFPEDVKAILTRIRAVIRDSAPKAIEKMSYNMPSFHLNGALIWFGAFKNHIGIYPRTTYMEASLEELSAYKGTKGSVHFPLDKPMPYELIGKIVKVRVEENQKIKD